MNRLRECSYALAFWAMSSLVLATVVDASAVTCPSRSMAVRSASPARPRLPGFRVDVDDLFEKRGEPLAGFPDPAQRLLVLGRRPESELVGKGRGRKLYGGTQSRPVDGPAPFLPSIHLVLRRKSALEGAIDRLGEQTANLAGVAPELGVCGGSHLERPQRLHPLVGLPEESEAEHSHDDDEERRAHERDEELDVDACRHASDRPDEGVVGRAQQPALRGTGCLVLLSDGLVRQALRPSAPPSCPRSS